MSSEHLFHKWGAGVAPDLPRIERAYDEFLLTDDGEELLDAAAGAAVANLGHSVPDVADVVAEQTERVSYLSLSHFTHAPAEALAERVADLAPGDLDTVFLTGSGSEANEAAFKLAHAYHRSRGAPGKHKVVSRWQAYHGSTLGALAASGNTTRRVPFDAMLPAWPHIGPAYPYRWGYEGTPEEQARAAAGELETTIEQEGPETVAAFVAEPVGGASIPAARPHPAYYEEVRRICDEYDVLLIADEVMTGFGRTGSMFAVEHYDVVPDLLVVGKGLSAGYAPISGVVVRESVAEPFRAGGAGSFPHGHTYAGNPVAAAVAGHVVERYTPDLLATGRERGETIRAELEPLDSHPMVGEIRHTGAMIGVEFVADRETKEPFDPDLHVYERVYDAAMERGVYTYPGRGSVDGVAGDHVMLAPPLNVSEESAERIGRSVVESVEAVAEDVL
ncbi:aspartate aminotransferase family protein [Salinirubellus sp. GCM10025818]|uniref:aminotransferase family protein n=1 Tax=Salinirubellus TaxID=2162630 RepID=UPI0030CC9013